MESSWSGKKPPVPEVVLFFDTTSAVLCVLGASSRLLLPKSFSKDSLPLNLNFFHDFFASTVRLQAAKKQHVGASREPGLFHECRSPTTLGVADGVHVFRAFFPPRNDQCCICRRHYLARFAIDEEGRGSNVL